MKKFFSLSLCGVLTAAAVAVNMATPVCAYADAGTVTVIPDNPSDATVVTVESDEKMDTNRGEITNNRGTVANNGTADNDKGSITNNYGTITDNRRYGVVDVNESGAKIDFNYGIVKKNQGTIGETSSVGAPGGLVELNDTNGTIGSCYGRITENKGTVNQTYYWACITDNMGTVTTNEGTVATNNGQIDINNSMVDVNGEDGIIGADTISANKNNGTVNTNFGKVVQSDSGKVLINVGGSVIGGTIEKSIGTAGSGTNANTINQYWLLTVSGDEGSFSLAGNKAEALYVYNSKTYMSQNNASNNYSVIVSSGIAGKIITELNLSEAGGCEYKDNGNGTFTISNVSKNIAFELVFGDYIPPVVIPEQKPVIIVISEEQEQTVLPADNNEVTQEIITPVLVDATGKVVPGKVETAKIEENDVQGIADTILKLAANNKFDVTKAKIFSTYAVAAKKNCAMTLNVFAQNNASAQKFGVDDIVYVLLKDKLTGKYVYQKAVVNANGTISFVLPFDDCTVTVVRMNEKAN